MTTTATIWSQFSTNVTRWERRTPESLVYMWLMLVMLIVLLVIVDVANALMGHPFPLASVFVICQLSALSAIWVTNIGLRDVQIYKQRVAPMGHMRLHMQEMVQGWCLSVFLLCVPMAIHAWMSPVSMLMKVLPVMLLVLFWHTSAVCAVHAWWGVAHPLHLVVPVLSGLSFWIWPRSVFDVWSHANLGIWLLVTVYGLGAAFSVYTQALASIKGGNKPLYRLLSKFDAVLHRWFAQAGFMQHGNLNGRAWVVLLGPGIVIWQIPTIHIGNHGLLEHWGTELSLYEHSRIGFLTLFLMSVLRSDLWHWRVVLSPQSPVRKNFGLRIILSTGRFVALCSGFWAGGYMAMQLCFENQSVSTVLTQLALYLPVVFVDCWVAIALATCLTGALTAWQAAVASCLFLGSSSIWFFADWPSQAGMALARHGWVYGFFMSMAASLLTLCAQRIWRKKDLAHTWREYERLGAIQRA